MEIQSVPHELFLMIVEHMDLKSLIRSRGVNKRWRALIPAAMISPTRRKLYDLYYQVISSPSFLSSRRTFFANIQPLDRQTWVADMESQGAQLPEEFRTWILEWPTAALIWWMWPGLPYNLHHGVHAGQDNQADSFVRHSANRLSCTVYRATLEYKLFTVTPRRGWEFKYYDPRLGPHDPNSPWLYVISLRTVAPPENMFGVNTAYLLCGGSAELAPYSPKCVSVANMNPAHGMEPQYTWIEFLRMELDSQST